MHPKVVFFCSIRVYLAIILIIALSSVSFHVHGQWKWNDPVKAGFRVIQNQGWSDEIGDTYVRLPERVEKNVRRPLWDLSRNSAGLGVYFYSNAPEIKIRYKVNGSYSMPHMPSTGVSGIDLYSIDSDGIWNFNFGTYSFGDTISYYYKNILKGKYHNYGYEYHLFLPLYNTVEWLEIGVPDSSSFEFIPQIQDKPIVLYGTSIAQGACASRPAMAWANILQRKMDHPLINLGFSGNGQLEEALLDLLNEIEARIYILDCLPNLTQKNEEEVYQLMVNAVKKLRIKNTMTPILLIEHAGYANAKTNNINNDEIVRVNKSSRKAYEALITDGFAYLYYLSHEEIDIPADGWVDYVHPSDLGMQQQASVVEKKIREILNEPKGNRVTTIPVTQRREPGNYEWQKRHNAILELNKSNPPKAVIFGNSITHFWGGKLDAKTQPAGADSWKQYMEPAGYHNLGYGWDRIENVLWRVYHGEIDSPGIQKVTMMIGTNNLVTTTDDNIVEGIGFLISAIKTKQPDAAIKVVGILPRRNYEQRILALNLRIKEVAKEKGCLFINPGANLLDQSGKVEESYFSDGLHPNVKGYQIIAVDIAN